MFRIQFREQSESPSWNESLTFSVSKKEPRLTGSSSVHSLFSYMRSCNFRSSSNFSPLAIASSQHPTPRSTYFSISARLVSNLQHDLNTAFEIQDGSTSCPSSTQIDPRGWRLRFPGPANCPLPPLPSQSLPTSQNLSHRPQHSHKPPRGRRLPHLLNNLPFTPAKTHLDHQTPSHHPHGLCSPRRVSNNRC